MTSKKKAPDDVLAEEDDIAQLQRIPKYSKKDEAEDAPKNIDLITINVRQEPLLALVVSFEGGPITVVVQYNRDDDDQLGFRSYTFVADPLSRPSGKYYASGSVLLNPGAFNKRIIVSIVFTNQVKDDQQGAQYQCELISPFDGDDTPEYEKEGQVAFGATERVVLGIKGVLPRDP